MPPKVDPAKIKMPPASEVRGKRKRGESESFQIEEYSLGPLAEEEQARILVSLVENKDVIGFALLDRLSDWIKEQPKEKQESYKASASLFSRRFLYAIQEVARANSDPKVHPRGVKICFYEAFIGPWPNQDLTAKLVRKDSVYPVASGVVPGSSPKVSPKKVGMVLHRTSSELKGAASDLWRRQEKQPMSPEKARHVKRGIAGMVHKKKAERVQADAAMRKFLKEYPQLARFLDVQLRAIEKLGQAVKADLRAKAKVYQAEAESRKQTAAQVEEISSSVETLPATPPASDADAASADGQREQKRPRLGSAGSAFYRPPATTSGFGELPATPPGPA